MSWMRIAITTSSPTISIGHEINPHKLALKTDKNRLSIFWSSLY